MATRFLGPVILAGGVTAALFWVMTAMITVEELEMFITDFPHPDSKYPKAVETFLANDRVSDESKRKILWDNTIDFYRFSDEMLPDKFEEAAPR